MNLQKMAALIAFSIFASSCFAGSNYVFAGVPWGSTADTFRDKVLAAGFKAENSSADALTFSGQVLGKKTIVRALMDNGKLVKVVVTLVTPDREARTVYKTMKDELVTKYGRPKNEIEFFQPPYKEGDGYEDQAIRVGKGHFVSAWQGDAEPPSTYRENLMLSITEQLAVSVSYESSQWGPVVDRRNKSSTKAF